MENNKFKVLYLLGSDNLVVKKNNEFIIYQGSHGDKGASIADVILPNPAYTEQNGLYINLEGRVQECRKASYPTDESEVDWKIFDKILKKLNLSTLNADELSLRKEVLNMIPNFSEIDMLPSKRIKNTNKEKSIFENEKININKIDYYYTNAISRASKTMAECRAVKKQQLKYGTNN